MKSADFYTTMELEIAAGKKMHDNFVYIGQSYYKHLDYDTLILVQPK